MKHFGLLLIAVLAVSALVLPLVYFSIDNKEEKSDDFFFGVTYGQDTVEGAELLIDKVQNITNVFVIDSWPISNNKTALDSICNYAAGKNLSFFVYFFSLYSESWQRDWVTSAAQIWGDKFLGVYLRDEPGGRQIELNETVPSASNSGDAAAAFVQNLSSYWSMQFLKKEGIPVVTSDFALYWYDYKAGFDVIFAQLGWNNSRPLQIAQCRGAALEEGKDWGTIITWTYQQPPYIASGPETYQDMLASYDAGAKYILVFNYPQDPPTNQYGILADGHFLAMQQFWDYSKTHPRIPSEKRAEAAFVFPKNYGWGMRNGNDSIWGLWSPDDPSLEGWPLVIGRSLKILLDRYVIKLDVIFDGGGIDPSKLYSKVYMWNQTIT